MHPNTPRARPEALAVLACATVLSGTVLIPAVRPIVAALHGEDEGTMHAFMSVNMLGAVVGAPFFGWLADRTGARRRIVVGAAALDGLLLLACALAIPASLMLVLRTLQGAANMGVLSVLMGSASGATPGERSRALGMAGAATMVAVALGAPLGTLLLRVDPLAPLWVGSLLPLAVAATVALVPLGDPEHRAAHAPTSFLGDAPRALWLPMSWVAAERFAVGCLVVSFSLYARRALALDDTTIGHLFSWFLVPFVLLTYPMARLSSPSARARLVVIGLLGYGAALGLLGVAPEHALSWVMLAAGVSSAAVYGPSLCLAASLAPRERRATAMALLNAGGALGMLGGTACAGIVSGLLSRAGWGPERAYPLVFAIAAGAQWLVLAGSAPALRTLAREDEPTSLAPSAGLDEPAVP